ncbi:alpha/beta fold hydrolase [Pseudomonas corrugata]|uniref:alpha/beta fold hydrolase n=1 Tax=Pseudomonas corrugata TaxID=47879 RepID=UPI00158629CB|nr:alpha/beta hydrolase [Pseudomonas corrugata]MCI0992972.1 alpha/beta hydrolase [Pseudomonas corrugata]NUT63928.1 alpha/beta hydrolase [Pseudomonas corrugata]
MNRLIHPGVMSASSDGANIVVDGATFRSEYANVNGIRMHYLVSGNGEQPVLLIHGFPGSWRNWKSLMGRLLRAGYTPIVPDYRGAGETDISKDGYDKKNMARDLHELVAVLKLGRLDIVGHDMGLIVAYAYGALYPHETKHIILMDGFVPGLPGWEIPYNGNPANGTASKWHFRFFGETALKMIRGQEKTYLDMFFDEFVYPGNPKVDDEVRNALVMDYSRPGRMEAAFKLYSAWVESDANDNQAFAQNKLAVPVLTIGGDHSRGKTLAEQVNHISYRPHSLILQNTGHWVLEEKAQATAQAILDFLQDRQ